MSSVKPLDPKKFAKFSFPLVRKPYKKLMAEDLVGTPDDRADLFDGVARHLTEVVEALKNCKCPKCVSTDVI